nr:MAG TPA: endopeptidase tail [Caudoviricetes sp.]
MNYKLYVDGELFFASDWNEKEYRLISPKIKLELNKSGSVEFTILPTHPLYNAFSPMKSIVTVYRDNALIFDGRVLSGDADNYKQRRVYCEGALAYLVDSVLPPCKGTRTAEEHYRLIINAHNEQVEPEKRFSPGIVSIDQKSESQIFGEDSYRENFSSIETDLLDAYGGYLRIRYDGSTRYLDYVKSYDSANSQKIRFGSNLLDLTNKRSGEDLFTILLPIGKDKLTIEGAGSSTKYVHNGRYLENPEAIALYGRIIKLIDFGNVEDPNSLLHKTEKYMDDNYKGIPPELTVKAFDLHTFYPTIEPFNLGDDIVIESEPHEISRTLMCTAVELDLTSPDKDQYTLTDPNQITIQKDRTLSGSASSTSNTASKAKRSGAGGAAAASLLEQFITEVDGVLTIKDRKIHLESMPGGTLGQITAALDIGDGQIISNVKNSLDTLSSKITQTESSLTSEINNKVEGLNSKITQTDSSIRADVTDSINKVQGSLELTIKDVDGLKQSVLTIDTDITDINSEITNIKKLYAKKATIEELYATKAYVADLTSATAVVGLLKGQHIFVGDLDAHDTSTNMLTVNGPLRYKGATVNPDSVKVVTDFTQASTYGIYLEGDKYVTFLRTSEAFVPTTYTPAYGDTITFT